MTTPSVQAQRPPLPHDFRNARDAAQWISDHRVFWAAQCEAGLIKSPSDYRPFESNLLATDDVGVRHVVWQELVKCIPTDLSDENMRMEDVQHRVGNLEWTAELVPVESVNLTRSDMVGAMAKASILMPIVQGDFSDDEDEGGDDPELCAHWEDEEFNDWLTDRVDFYRVDICCQEICCRKN